MDGEEVEEEYEESIDLGEEDDDDLDGSPKSVAWKYAWSMNSSNAGSARGAGNAASERLYSGARSNREAREKLQRQELRRAHKTETRHKPAINQKSAEMAETRFDDVMNRTAIGRYRKEVRAIAGVKGGAKEAGRVSDVFNYGDMLFQEGKMTAARKDQARSDELRRRERDDPECTFKPKVSGLARQFAHHEHLAERSESLIIEQQARPHPPALLACSPAPSPGADTTPASPSSSPLACPELDAAPAPALVPTSLAQASAEACKLVGRAH